jgi:ribosomal protein S18 acetylase RimI-like enzyme
MGIRVGKELLKGFENKLWGKGAPFIYLITDRDNNQAAQEFYGKLGWEIESEFSTPEGRPMRRYWKRNPALPDSPQKINR